MLNMLTFLGAGMSELAYPFHVVLVIGIGITWIAGACWNTGMRIEERNSIEERNRMNAIAHQTQPIEVVTR